MKKRSLPRQGATLVLVAIMLPVVLLLAAFAINLAYMELNRTEMYVAADSAARAGGRQFTLTGDINQAKVASRAAAARNHVGGRVLQFSDSDFVFGESSRNSLDQRYNFNSGGAHPNALQLTGRRTTGSADGAQPMLLPGVLGRSTFEPFRTSRSTQLEVDIALVLDRSGSMAYAATEPARYPPVPAAAPPGWFFCDPAPPQSRWLDAVNAVSVFLNEISQTPGSELVSLTTYSSSASIDRTLTSDYGSIQQGMDAYTQNFCSGLTNIGDGINQGRNTFTFGNARPYAAKVIIVMTDGLHNTGQSPISAAQSAVDQGIMIFTVTFALEADQASMQQVAQIGLGRHYHATNGVALAGIFQDIARQIPVLLTQ